MKQKFSAVAKAVIFDMDGLMFNTETVLHQAQTEVLARRNKSFTSEMKRKIMGMKAEAVMQMLKAELDLTDQVDDLIKERNELYISLLLPRLQPMPGLLELLFLLERWGIRKSIATSSPAEWAEIILSHLSLRSKFEVIVTGDEITRGKPDAEIYFTVLNRLELNSGDCVVLEDSINGVLSAKGAGIKCIAIPNKFTIDEDFSAADLVVSNLLDPKLITFIGLPISGDIQNPAHSWKLPRIF